MYRNGGWEGGGGCGGQVPYCTAGIDIIFIIISSSSSSSSSSSIEIRLIGVVTRLWAGRYGVRISAGTKYVSLLQSFHRGSGVHPATFSIGTVVPFPGVKRPARDVDNSHPSSTEVKNEWSYASTSLIRLHGLGRDNFDFCVSKISVLWNVRFCRLLYGYQCFGRNLCLRLQDFST